MMPPALKAAALLALVVVASADRALLQQTGGNSLHGVAVGYSNYWITNNNGTWTLPTLYNSGSSVYGSSNTAFSNANTATGAFALLTSGTPSNNAVAGTIFQGLTAVTFPSKNLGVAVGVAKGLVAGTASLPSIMITTDSGLTWLAVTGTPAVAPQLTTATAAGGVAAYPSAGPGDLAGVFMASKSVGWAVGSTALNGGFFSTAQTGYGVILMTANGGTVWKSVLPPPYTSTQSSNLVAGTLTGTFAGDLFSVSADAAGKNVYAVGAPSFTGTVTYVSTGNTFASTAASTPTILFSGNSGSSWAFQTAPAATAAYTLFSVAVKTGTTAWAVGGALSITPSSSAAGTFLGGASNGQIIYTTNGGFSWIQASFPGNSGKAAPGFTSVALNGATVWVGGFVRQNQHYPTAPVLGYVAAGSSFVSTGQTPANGQSYGILVSTNGKTFVGAASAASFPPGFIYSKATEPDTNAATTPLNLAYTFYDVLGITWDNSLHGWIYGNGFILATADGGKTWVYETPATASAALASATGYGTQTVYVIANVPTSY